MGPLSLSEVFGENKQIANPEAEVKKKKPKQKGRKEMAEKKKKKTHEKSNGVRRRNLLGAV